MKGTKYVSALAGYFQNRRARRATGEGSKHKPRRASPFTVESLEARLLLSADLAGAAQQTPVVQAAAVQQQQQAAASAALAPTLYVSNSGSDGNSGHSASEALRTIGKAGEIAQAGDVVSIKGGTYKEYAVIENSGTASNRITFMAAPGERVIVDGSGKSPTPNDPWGNLGVIHVRGNYVTIQGIEVKNAASDGVEVEGRNVILDNLHIHDTYMNGVRFSSTWDGVIQNSLIHDTYDWNNTNYSGGNADGIGLTGEGGGGRHTVRNNVVYNTSDDGIDTWTNSNNVIENNIVHNAGRDQGDGNGFKLGPGGNNIVRNNVAYDNRTNGFDPNEGGGNQIYNNTAYHNGGENFINYSQRNTFKNNISSSGSTGMDSLAAQSFNSWNLGITNPNFASTDSASANFLRLASGSPAIDAGTNVGLSYSGAAPDLGAYEANGAAPAPAPAPTPTPSPGVQSGTINVAQATRDSGHAYYVSQNFGTPGDSEQALTVSKLRIFENGKELGPAHQWHATIEQQGAGRFSHWGNGLYFSASDNSNPITNGRTYTYVVSNGSPSTSPSTSSSYREGVINVAQATRDSGHAYYVAQNFGTPGDSEQALTVSKLRIFENGKELGPAHQWHATIEQQGAGRFSHWGNGLYFSASDNSNPVMNGRTYTYRVYA
jgi:parallel beta-helix repeat protein